MQANHPQTIEYMVITAQNRKMQWPAFDYDSLLRSLHYFGHTAKEIMTLEEYEVKERERELKETA